MNKQLDALFTKKENKTTPKLKGVEKGLRTRDNGTMYAELPNNLKVSVKKGTKNDELTYTVSIKAKNLNAEKGKQFYNLPTEYSDQVFDNIEDANALVQRVYDLIAKPESKAKSEPAEACGIVSGADRQRPTPKAKPSLPIIYVLEDANWKFVHYTTSLDVAKAWGKGEGQTAYEVTPA